MEEAPCSEGNVVEQFYGSLAIEASQHPIADLSFIDASTICFHVWFEALPSLPPIFSQLIITI